MRFSVSQPQSYLCLPNGMRARPHKENSLCTIARLQIADNGLPVSLVQSLLDSQC
jgi:hypothetical protein